jgi:excisionase family DNA binding protein
VTIGDLVLGEELARELGIAPSTLREWARRGLVPNRKMPHTRRVLFSRADVEAWLAGAELETKLLAGDGRLVAPKGKR